MKAYIIHLDQSFDRNGLVQDLQQKTGAEIVKAVHSSDGRLGCLVSHLKVALKAKQENPEKSYLVFEDDCVLLEDIDVILNKFNIADITYLGYNSSSYNKNESCMYFYGTHALLISPKVRDLFIENLLDCNEPIDHKISKLIKKFNLSVACPTQECCEMYAMQQKGLLSTITNMPRA